MSDGGTGSPVGARRSGGALSPIPVVAAIGLLGTRRPLTNSLGFVAGWMAHLAAVSAVLLAAIRGQGPFGGAALTRPLAVVLLAVGVALLVGAFATWRARPAGAGPLRRRLGRMDQLSPRTAFLAGLLAVSLNAKNVALTLATVHGIQSAHAGVGEGVAIMAPFIMVGTAGVAAPAALSVALPARAGPPLEAWRVRLAEHSGAIVSWVLLGAGALLTISALLALCGWLATRIRAIYCRFPVWVGGLYGFVRGQAAGGSVEWRLSGTVNNRAKENICVSSSSS